MNTGREGATEQQTRQQADLKAREECENKFHFLIFNRTDLAGEQLKIHTRGFLYFFPL